MITWRPVCRQIRGAFAVTFRNPLNFREFLYAMGEESLADALPTKEYAVIVDAFRQHKDYRRSGAVCKQQYFFLFFLFLEYLYFLW